MVPFPCGRCPSDPSCNDGVVDAGEQAYQLVEILSIETRLVRRGPRSPILDRFDPIRAIIVYQAPEADCLLEELPAILELVDDLGIFESASHRIWTECVQRHGVDFSLLPENHNTACVDGIL